MEAIALEYHDIVKAGQQDSSGFPGAWAAFYKCEEEEFRQHIEAIRTGLGGRPVRTIDQFRDWGSECPLFLTFDDGGVSSSAIAAQLESRGWRGHFFVVTSRIGEPGFLDADQIRELRKRGHVVGTHSHSHPSRMSACSWEELVAEWRESAHILADILAEPVISGAVPGGYYSEQVGVAASKAGLRYLFTSEPARKVRQAGECLVVGRYALSRGMTPSTAAGFAAGRFWPCAKQKAFWKLKGIAKTLGGGAYFKLAERIRNR